MAKTPASFTPKARAEQLVAAPAASAQMPPQAASVMQQMDPPAPPPEPTRLTPEVMADIDPDVLADILRRRMAAPPVGSSKLAIAPRVGWVRRWVNDTPGRVYQKQQLGWNIAKNPETGENWALVVNNAITEAGGLKGYVMEIPLQFYREDQDAKQKKLDELDNQIYGGTYNEEPDDKRYVPKSTPIRVETRVGPGSG